MPDFVLPLGCAALVAAVLWVLPIALRARTRHLQYALAQMEDAHEAARRLLKAEGTPVELVGPIIGFSQHAGRPHLANSLLRDLVTGGARPTDKQMTPADRAALRRVISDMGPENYALFQRLIGRSLVSSTAANPVAAGALLPLVEFAVKDFDVIGSSGEPVRTERAQIILEDMAPRMRDCAVAA